MDVCGSHDWEQTARKRPAMVGTPVVKARRITGGIGGAHVVASATPKAKACASPMKRPAASVVQRPAGVHQGAENGGGLRLGTDFGGMDTPLLALKKMGYAVRHVFNCEKNLSCIKMSTNITSPDCCVRYKDITTRNNDDVPKVDLYCAGIPCLTWAQGGNQEGVDGDTGGLWFNAIDYITKRTPKAVVLECAPTLLTQKKFEANRRQFVNMIESAGYEVFVTLIRTDEHGLPQTRVRFYLVAIKLTAKRRTFTWPTPLTHTVPVNKIIMGNKVTTLKGMLPDHQREKDHVLAALRSAASCGVELKTSRIIVDIGGTSQFAHYTVDEFPTITATRAVSFAFWVADLGRRVTLDELMLLQGFDPAMFEGRKEAKVTDARLAHMVGNAMSCNVLERLLPRVLDSIGITPDVVKPDRWDILVRRSNPVVPMMSRVRWQI